MISHSNTKLSFQEEKAKSTEMFKVSKNAYDSITLSAYDF